MKLCRLTRNAVIVPENSTWGAQVLGAGSVVEVLPVGKASYITGKQNEIYVRWLDVSGRENTGWLAMHTPMDSKAIRGGLRHEVFDRADGLSAWDNLRAAMAWPPKYSPPLVLYWAAVEARKHDVVHTKIGEQIRLAVRELGGKVSSKDDVDGSILRLLRITLNREVTMSDVKSAAKHTTTDAATKTATKKASKKASKTTSTKTVKAKAEGNGAGRKSAYAGKTIVRLVKENPRREGTHGFNSWRVLKKGMTYEQYIAAGGRREDLAWDLAKGNVKLSGKK